MKILIDMNISPDWREVLQNVGWDAVHWSQIGDPSASDSTILSYARDNDYVLFTHDLDFGSILAATRAQAPSVIQVRYQDLLSEHFRSLVIGALRHFESALESGALVTVDASRSRARVLPLT